jgi:hypothetical protein
MIALVIEVYCTSMGPTVSAICLLQKWRGRYHHEDRGPECPERQKQRAGTSSSFAPFLLEHASQIIRVTRVVSKRVRGRHAEVGR